MRPTKSLAFDASTIVSLWFVYIMCFFFRFMCLAHNIHSIYLFLCTPAHVVHNMQVQKLLCNAATANSGGGTIREEEKKLYEEFIHL